MALYVIDKLNNRGEHMVYRTLGAVGQKQRTQIQVL